MECLSQQMSTHMNLDPQGEWTGHTTSQELQCFASILQQHLCAHLQASQIALADFFPAMHVAG